MGGRYVRGMTASETDLLESVLARTGDTLAGVRADQLGGPTPCAEFDVAALVDHLVGWARSFAARLTGGAEDGPPDQYCSGDRPAEEFHAAGAQIVRAYREGTEAAAKLPIGVLVMEFMTHGWDLATATGQDAGYPSAAAEFALEAGRGMLKPEYRGPGKSFGPEVAVTDSADPVERVVAFLGRDPHDRRWAGAQS